MCYRKSMIGWRRKQIQKYKILSVRRCSLRLPKCLSLMRFISKEVGGNLSRNDEPKRNLFIYLKMNKLRLLFDFFSFFSFFLFFYLKNTKFSRICVISHRYACFVHDFNAGGGILSIKWFCDMWYCSHAMIHACSLRIFIKSVTVSGIFFLNENQSLFRPSLYRVDWYSNCFQFVFQTILGSGYYQQPFPSVADVCITDKFIMGGL